MDSTQIQAQITESQESHVEVTGAHSNPNSCAHRSGSDLSLSPPSTQRPPYQDYLRWEEGVLHYCSLPGDHKEGEEDEED
jgi:hypothetical protein